MTTSYVCIVDGKVSGGTLKVWVLETAQRLGLTGWVRFLSNDKAEILLQGNAAQFESFRNLLKDDAPLTDPKSIVCSVEEHDKAYDSFEMR